MHCAGDGPPAVLVHGYPLDHRMWLDLMRSKVAARRMLAAVDLRGHGGSPWAGESAHEMEILADDVAAVIAEFGRKADVIALSMGGYAALALAERHPDAIRSLVLADTRAGKDSDEGKRARSEAMDSVVANGRRWLADQMIPRLVAPRTGAFVRGRLQTMIEETPVETILADLAGMRDRKDRSALLSGIAFPTLVVVGESDVLTPPEEARAMANAIPGARLSVLPGAGHMVPMEAPDAFAEAIDSFLGGSSS